LNREIAAVVAQPSIAADYVDQGYEVVAGSPDEMARGIASDLERFRILIRSMRIEPQ
jgi:hypothetical protein